MTVSGYIEKAAKEFDELVKRARKRRYATPVNVGLELIANAYKSIVRDTRQRDRRTGKKVTS